LTIEHNLKETAFRHRVDENKKIVKHSPYQQVFNENDRLGQLTQAFTFLNGDSLTATELKTLQNAQMPGVNQRYGMPAKPPVH
jgi:hypothetical protein